MGESLTEQYLVSDEGFRVVKLSQQGKKGYGSNRAIALTVPAEEAPANYVPAAAVIRKWQALSGFTGRKERVGGFLSWGEIRRPNLRPASKTGELEFRRGSGIPCVAVKCVDIWENTNGESSFWTNTDAEA